MFKFYSNAIKNGTKEQASKAMICASGAAALTKSQKVRLWAKTQRKLNA